MHKDSFDLIFAFWHILLILTVLEACLTGLIQWHDWSLVFMRQTLVGSLIWSNQGIRISLMITFLVNDELKSPVATNGNGFVHLMFVWSVQGPWRGQVICISQALRVSVAHLRTVQGAQRWIIYINTKQNTNIMEIQFSGVGCLRI